MTVNYLRPIQEAWSVIPAGPAAALRPSPSAELDRLEALLPPGHRLPEALRAHLLWGGEKAGNLYRSVDFSTPMISIFLERRLQSIEAMVARHGGTEPLPADMLVINEYLGSSFTYLLLSEGDNPPVYMWEEGGNGGLRDAVLEAPTFVEWVVLRIARYAELVG